MHSLPHPKKTQSLRRPFLPLPNVFPVYFTQAPCLSYSSSPRQQKEKSSIYSKS